MLMMLALACTTAEDSADGDDVTHDGVDDEGLRTLDSCAESFAADVPAFYSTYFRCIDISMDGDEVVLGTNDLPPHKSSYYPESDPNWEAWDDRGGEYTQNPNSIATQGFVIRIPAAPVAKGITITDALVDLTMMTSDEEYSAGTIGVGLDGVSLYNATAGPGDDIRDEKYGFDMWEAHPSPDSAYHHHSPNPGALAVLVAAGFATTSVPGTAEVELFGINCDGTVVLGCTELDGSDVAAGELDAQGGHLGDLRDADGTTHFEGRYHTHMCAAIDVDAFTPEIQYYDSCEVAGAAP